MESALPKTNKSLYFEKIHDQHLKEVRRRTNVQGRMREAIEKSDGTAADGFFRFFESEMNIAAAHSGICLIYMPHFGINKRNNRHGKIIIEIDSREEAWTLVKDCFELQFAPQTNLNNVQMQLLERKTWPADDVVRYNNLFVTWEDSFPLVQRVLFCDLFRQRFLMTMDSRTLGKITTQRLMSGMGQFFSLRACVLKE